MEKLGLNEIREEFLKYFEGKGHLRLPSFSLIPVDDASLLLINAGMAPLKPFFTGKEKPPAKRVVTCQKCIRTPDIEMVGKTARHGTFFEMLGNFSFGDYFKREAIGWAWEFVTEVLKLPRERLWVTIFEEDDEAGEIWVNETDISPERIVKMGREDNFWEIGTGPCGPCSEIYFDRGAGAGCGRAECAIGCECDRFVEFWNLVFTQFDKDAEGSYNKLEHPNIDTGMGLERIAAIMQGADNLFEVDTIKSITQKISDITGAAYGEGESRDVSLRVITDHIRSATFLIGDGVGPSNEGRGYVVRRLIRRAARHGRLLGVGRPFLYEVCPVVIEASKKAYPELFEAMERISRVIKREEERFGQTLEDGLRILGGYIEDVKSKGGNTLPGDFAFKLYDTYGFPPDLTVEILADGGLLLDKKGFDEQMEKQRVRARAARKEGDEASWSGDVFKNFNDFSPVSFTGYDKTRDKGVITALAVEGEKRQTLGAGEVGILITDKTPFYGEGGGQAGDRGEIYSDFARAEVLDTKNRGEGKIYHIVKVCEGELATGDLVTLAVNRRARLAAARNHSATHLLHKALKEVLGEHVSQAGSFVNSDRLRFDFSHYEQVSGEKLGEIEKKVNDAILDILPVRAENLSLGEAKRLGAQALFGEKYGEIVRVVSMGEYSTELCGGTHVSSTAEIGLFKILSEGAIAAGVRRIEATTGGGVLEYIKERDGLIFETAGALGANNAADIAVKAGALAGELKAAQKAAAAAKERVAGDLARELLEKATPVAGVSVIIEELAGFSAAELRSLGDRLCAGGGVLAAVLGAENEGKLSFLAVATEQAVNKGVHSGEIIKEITKIAGGSGGGKPQMAQGGGKDVKMLKKALEKAVAIIESRLSNA